MKTIFNTAIKTAVVAAALAFAGASHAANFTATSNFGGTFSNPAGSASFGAGHPSVGIDVYTLSDGSSSYFAFCIEPLTSIQSGATYTATSPSISTSIQRLYETSYAGVQGNNDKQVAFQLALWELAADDGNLYAAGGLQHFAPANTKAAAADVMLQKALDTGIALQGTYHYTTFTGVSPTLVKSQTLLAVTAVPEADTWAMMAAGLGLLGLVRRRKSAATEKFA
jgi:MYXO-CTERM domain-containing protein